MSSLLPHDLCHGWSASHWPPTRKTFYHWLSHQGSSILSVLLVYTKPSSKDSQVGYNCQVSLSLACPRLIWGWEKISPQGKCQKCVPVLHSLSVHLKSHASTFSAKSESMLWKSHLSEPLSQGRGRTLFSFIQSHTKACVNTYSFLPLFLSRTASCLQSRRKGRGDCFSYLKKKKKKIQPCNSGSSYISDCIRALVRDEKKFRPLAFSQDMAREVHWLCISSHFLWPCG